MHVMLALPDYHHQGMYETVNLLFAKRGTTRSIHITTAAIVNISVNAVHHHIEEIPTIPPELNSESLHQDHRVHQSQLEVLIDELHILGKFQLISFRSFPSVSVYVQNLVSC